MRMNRHLLRSVFPWILFATLNCDVHDIDASGFINIKVGGKEFSALVSLQAPMAYVTGSKAVINCTDKDYPTYDPTSPRIANLSSKEDFIGGGVYNEAVEFFDKQYNSFYFAVRESEQPYGDHCPRVAAGLGLSLDLGRREFTGFHQILVDKESKVIIIQRGLPTWSDKEPKGGKIAFGETNIEQCNLPPIYHRASGGSDLASPWTLRGNLTVGTNVLTHQDIGFRLTTWTWIPSELYNTYFSGERVRRRKDPTDIPFPTIRFSVGGQTYFQTEDDYLKYTWSEDKWIPYIAINHRFGEMHDDVVIGDSFLANYCVFLKEEAGVKYMGFGQVKGKERPEPPPDEPLPSPTSSTSTTPATASSSTPSPSPTSTLQTTTISAAAKVKHNISILATLLILLQRI